MKHFSQVGYTEILITPQQLSQQAYQLYVSIVNNCESWVFYCCKAAKHSLTDSVTQHLQESKPLVHDLLSLSQSRELSINSNKK